MVGLFMSLGSGEIIETTIQHSREIEASFQKVVAFIERFQQANSRLPDGIEFKNWGNRQSPSADSPYGMELHTVEFPKEAIEELGTPPEHSYLLSLWRGEWEEYYASWTGESSLIFAASAYYILGSPMSDTTGVIVVFVILCFAAIKLWRRVG